MALAVWLTVAASPLAPTHALGQRATLDPETLGAGTQIRGMVGALDGGIWLLTVRDVAGRPQWSVVALSSALDIETRLELAPGDYAALTAFGAGFLVSALPSPSLATPDPTDPHELQAFNGVPETPPHVLHRWLPNNPGRPLFAPARDSDAVYILESPYSQVERRRQSSLLKVDAAGRTLWTLPLENGDLHKLVAVDDGVVVEMSPQPRVRLEERDATQISLIGVSAAGKIVWQALMTHRGNLRDMLYLGNDRLALDWAHRDFKADAAEVQVLDLGTRRTHEFALPRAYGVQLRAAPGGLLVAATLLSQPYLSLVTPEGERIWWRRVKVAPGSRFDRRSYYPWLAAEPLAHGDLAVLAGWREWRETQELRSLLIVTDGRAEQLGAAYGRCLGADPVPMVVLEQRLLKDFGIGVRLGPDEAADERSGSCEAPSEEAYLDFLVTFDRTLRELGAGKWGLQSAVSIAVDDSQSPYRLAGYQLRKPIFDAPGTVFQYATRADSAAALAHELVDDLAPHFARLDAAVIEFSELTGHSLSVEEHPSAPARAYLRGIEKAMDTILGVARSLDDGERARLHAADDRRYFVFNASGFGEFGHPLQPLPNVRRVLLDGRDDRAGESAR